MAHTEVAVKCRCDVWLRGSHEVNITVQ